MAEIKPCSVCGNKKTYVDATTEYVSITCASCGARTWVYGSTTRRYASVGRCMRWLMPKAIEYWNKRYDREDCNG